MDDDKILEKARSLRAAADELQRLAVDVSAMWRMSEMELRSASDRLAQAERTMEREREKMKALLEYYNRVKDEYMIEMCTCGRIIDLNDSQQAESKLCHVCLTDATPPTH